MTEPSTTIPNPVDVPSADDAAGIAQSLLDGFGVLDGQKWAHDVTDANGVAFSCAPDATSCNDTPAPPVTARTVTYELLVDGARVPGIDWSVTVGEHRAIESVSGTWASVGDPSQYALRSTNDVFDDLQHGRAQYPGPQPMLAQGSPEAAPLIAPGTVLGTAPDTVPPLEVHITGVALGSTRWDGTDNGHPAVYVVPTYRFHARVGPVRPLRHRAARARSRDLHDRIAAGAQGRPRAGRCRFGCRAATCARAQAAGLSVRSHLTDVDASKG